MTEEFYGRNYSRQALILANHSSTQSCPSPHLGKTLPKRSWNQSTLYRFRAAVLIWHINDPGVYCFTDYLKLGIPFNLLFLILGALFVPLFCPFRSMHPVSVRKGLSGAGLQDTSGRLKNPFGKSYDIIDDQKPQDPDHSHGKGPKEKAIF